MLGGQVSRPGSRNIAYAEVEGTRETDLSLVGCFVVVVAADVVSFVFFMEYQKGLGTTILTAAL